MAGRFIKLYDKILSWEWYKNTNVKVLFLHLLLKANYKDLSFEGHKILRGQLVTSLPSLSAELGMSTKQVRGSLEHLISTGEVASKSYPRYRVITIVHYDDYQSYDSQEGSQTADERAVKRQPKGSQRAGSGQAEGSQRAASIEYIEDIERKKRIERVEEGERTPPSPPSPLGTGFIPPTKDEILDYCLENHYGIDVDRFHANYSSKGWKVNGQQIVDWKALVKRWAAEDARKVSIPAAPAQAPARKVVAQQYDQRDYGQEDEDAMKRILEAMRNE